MKKFMICILLGLIFYSCNEDSEISSNQEYIKFKNEVLSFDRSVVNSNRSNKWYGLEKGKVYEIPNIKTSSERFNNLISSLVYKVDLNSMKVEVRKVGEAGVIKGDLILNDKGFYNVVINNKVPNVKDTKAINQRSNRSISSWLCAGVCAVTAVEIAAGDGPLPIADVAAMAYACGQDC